MAFHVDDNFRAGAPISQVPASWFNKVGAFLNNLVQGWGIKLTKGENGQPSVIELDPQVVNNVSRETGTPTTMGGFPTDDGITQSETNLWTFGGANGAEVEVLFKGEYENNTHKTYAAKLTFSADGLLTSIDTIENGGMDIGA